MEGKGWFVIYGILVLVTVYLFIVQQLQAGKINQLEADLAQLRSAGVAQETESPVEVSPAATASPDLSNAAGRDRQREADLATIAAALNSYRQSRGSFPDSLQQLVPDFLAEPLRDPMSPRFSYRYSKTSTGFHLTAYLETTDYPNDAADGQQDRTLTITESSS